MKKAQTTVLSWQIKEAILELYQYLPGTAELLPKHSHEDYQFGLSLDTNGGYFYRGTRYAVPMGSFSALHTGEVHTTTRKNTKIEASRTFWMLYVKPRLLQAIAQETGHPSSLPFFKIPVICDPELTHLFIQFCQAVTGSKLEQDCLLLRWLSLGVQRYSDLCNAVKPIGNERRRVELAREYLETHLSKNVSLEDLAQMAGLSPYHFSRVFRQEIGLPPHQYQIQARVARAKALLWQGMPVKKVARVTGFADQSHLTRQFKKFVQVTPGKYLPQK